MNLGVVLLPLRVFLGLISVYAGMGKLCDPVYFDGGERGSMVKWLNSLHPWALAEPLRDFALQHPVGAGLTVAFLQVVVGVLTILGLWQRVAAVVGALLSAALLLTVSWKSVPVYDSADIIYLAAWTPLIMAGAPVYSVDGRLAGEAWRTLGPRADLLDLRRRVTRRGSLLAAVVVGLTLLIGSVLGGAVRSTEMVTVPGPNDDPVNHLPGRPLQEPRGETSSKPATTTPRPAATAEKTTEARRRASGPGRRSARPSRPASPPAPRSSARPPRRASAPGPATVRPRARTPSPRRPPATPRAARAARRETAPRARPAPRPRAARRRAAGTGARGTRSAACWAETTSVRTGEGRHRFRRRRPSRAYRGVRPSARPVPWRPR